MVTCFEFFLVLIHLDFKTGNGVNFFDDRHCTKCGLISFCSNIRVAGSKSYANAVAIAIAYSPQSDPPLCLGVGAQLTVNS